MTKTFREWLRSRSGDESRIGVLALKYADHPQWETERAGDLKALIYSEAKRLKRVSYPADELLALSEAFSAWEDLGNVCEDNSMGRCPSLEAANEAAEAELEEAHRRELNSVVERLMGEAPREGPLAALGSATHRYLTEQARGGDIGHQALEMCRKEEKEKAGTDYMQKLRDVYRDSGYPLGNGISFGETMGWAANHIRELAKERDELKEAAENLLEEILSGRDVKKVIKLMLNLERKITNGSK